MQLDARQNILRQAEDAFRLKDFDHALTLLGVGFAEDMEFRPFYTLAAQLLERMKAPKEARLFWQALEHFEDWEPFFKIGFHFVDAWEYDMATPFMEKAHRLAADNADVAHELALCYANTFRVAEALTMLEGFQCHDFWTRYRLQRYKLLLGETETLSAYLEEASNALAQQTSNEAVPQGHALLDELRQMWRRYCLAGKCEWVAEWRLRQWHFIQYGSLLVEQMGKQHNEEQASAMQVDAGGRFIRYFGGLAHVHAILMRVTHYVRQSGLSIKKVVYLENRDDVVLGKALAKLLKLPAEPADGENLATPHALVVAANNETYNGEHELCQRQPHQLVFAFQVDWMQPAMICPDITGLLTLHYTYPWHKPREAEDSFMSLVSQAFGDPENLHSFSDEAVANCLVETPPSALESPAPEALCRVLAAGLPHGANATAHRPVFRMESPVRKVGNISPFMVG